MRRIPEETGVEWRSRHQIKKDHYEYKAFLAEDGLSDETSEESSLSSLTESDVRSDSNSLRGLPFIGPRCG